MTPKLLYANVEKHTTKTRLQVANGFAIWQSGNELVLDIPVEGKTRTVVHVGEIGITKLRDMCNDILATGNPTK